MLDSFLVEHLLYEHMAQVRRQAARRALLGPTAPRRGRRRGLMRRLVQAISTPALKRRIERRVTS
jgi:hypothetical protein